MATTLPDGLLAAVRNYLDVTWTDSDTDTKLTGIIARGMAYLDRVAGENLTYIDETEHRQLLMDYCRYTYGNALAEFEPAYQSELLALQMRKEAERYAAEQSSTG